MNDASASMVLITKKSNQRLCRFMFPEDQVMVLLRRCANNSIRGIRADF